MTDSFLLRLKRDLTKNKSLYLMVLPVIAFFVLFKYLPMYGASIAFKNFVPAKGIMGSDWVGFSHFERFFSSIYFWPLFRNTFLLSFYSLLFGFPAPILLALMLNEVSKRKIKRSIQTITYLPYFISLVVVIGMVKSFTATDGLINDILVLMGGERGPLLQKPEYFRALYISSDIWQQLGWNSIIYMAALAGIDVQLYEASIIDGASRWRQTIHITLPGISPVIIILLILRIGHMLQVGFEKIILMYSPATYSVADVIDSYVYRAGLLEFNWSYSSAIGLFKSVINFILLISANKICGRISETSLW